MRSICARYIFVRWVRAIAPSICALIFSLLSPSFGSAQLMINKGATIVTKTGALLHVNGAYQNNTGSIDDSGTVTVTSDFTNNAAATAGGSGLYNIAGHFTNDGTFVRKTGTVNLNGASNQNVGGAVTTTFYDLQFTNGGSKTLTKKEIVDSNCYFTNGVCYTTQTNVLNFTVNGNWVNNAGLPVAPAASYVDGPCEKDMNSTNLFWFPVGKSGRGNTCSITPSSATPTTFRTQYFNFPYTNTTSMQLPLQSISKIHYWHADVVTPSSGGMDAIIRLYWIPGDYTSSIYMSTMSNLVVARWDTLAPVSPGPTPAWMTAGVSALSAGANFNSGWIESSTVINSKYGNPTTNRPFTIASITADNSLPVEIGTFQARQVKNSVVLNWNTYSEVQNLGFELQRRQSDGAAVVIKSFVTDAALQAKSPFGAEYATTDENLPVGVYTYDLFQIDQNGTRAHAGRQTVNVAEYSIPKALSCSIYPNPAVSVAHVLLDLPEDAHVTATLYDVTGRFVQEIVNSDLPAGAQAVVSDVSQLPSGTYRMVVIAGNQRVMQNLVVTK